MKIRIDKTNKDAIAEALAKANGRATARTLDSQDVLDLAEALDKHMEKYHIPRSSAKGSRYLYSESVGCNSYDYRADATIVEFTHGSKCWFLTDARRGQTNTSRGSRSDWFYPSDGALDAAKNAMVKGIAYP